MKPKKITPYPLYNTTNPLLPGHANELDIFLDKPFWIWDEQEHNRRYYDTGGKCCHVDILGRPQKAGVDYPIFDYQKLIFDALEQNMNIHILKARGIGLSTFMLYYLTWKILSSSELDHKSIFIVSGTREVFGNYIKEKMAKLFERNFPLLNIYTKYTELVLKNTWIKVFPTTAVKDIRGYFECSYIWIDESSFFPDSVQDELISVIEPYQTKSNCKIILSSSPNKPNDLMNRLESNPRYFKLRLPYDYGLGKIYSKEDIEKAKQSVSFEREFNLKFLGGIGNLLTPQQVDQCIQLAEPLKDIPISNFNLHSVGLDWGFGSSRTAIVMTEHLKTLEGEDKIIVRFAEEYDHANPQDIVDICHSLYRKQWNTIFFVDGANRGAVNLMKVAFDESLNWDSKDANPELMKVIPINFSTEHKSMLSHLAVMINKKWLAIPKEHDKLITSLRTAYAREYNLDKEQTSYDDSLDALRLSLKAYQIE